jgi:hypothetical protein
MVSSSELQPDWNARYRGTDNGSVLQKFSGKWTTLLFKEFASCDTRTNAAVTWRDTSSFRQRVTGIFERTYEGRGIGTNGPVAWPARSPDFNPSDFFLCHCVKSRMWHCGQQKVRPHLVGVQNETSVGITNELRRLQWHNDCQLAYDMAVDISKIYCSNL